MQCKIEGCGRDAAYKEQGVCQKHYFRFMRFGTYELTQSRKYRTQNPAGYQKLYEPNHPLANMDGNVYEHRFIIYNKYGCILPDCEICGKPTVWETCHIDHKDNDVTNNAESNLRPVCNPCNTRRFYPEQHTIKGRYPITYGGVTKTASEWARHPGVDVSHATIKRRLAIGMSVYAALYAPKKTHNGIGKGKSRKQIQIDYRARIKAAIINVKLNHDKRKTPMPILHPLPH